MESVTNIPVKIKFLLSVENSPGVSDEQVHKELYENSTFKCVGCTHQEYGSGCCGCGTHKIEPKE